jgi:hypothetical protein
MNKIATYCLLSGLLFLASCQQRLYFPDRANSPGLTQAMEGKVTLSVKPQDKDDVTDPDALNFGLGADIAFSPINHLGIIGSYRHILNKTIEENQQYGILENQKTMGGVFNGKRFELGVGYYDTFGRYGKFEVYTGYGNGDLQRRGDAAPRYDYNTRYHRIFLQPALGFGRSGIFSMTAGLRITYLSFYDFRSDDPMLHEYVGREAQDVTRGFFPFVEPFVNMEGGYKYLKGNIQFGMSKQLAYSNIAGNMPVYISLGLVFHFRQAFD